MGSIGRVLLPSADIVPQGRERGEMGGIFFLHHRLADKVNNPFLSDMRRDDWVDHAPDPIYGFQAKPDSFHMRFWKKNRFLKIDRSHYFEFNRDHDV
jgi:hypothetical protein